MKPIPVILFAYARPDHLRRTLASLKENHVPLIYAFSDGPATSDKLGAVNEVRQILRSLDWCELILCERDTNYGLGHSILSGVSKVLEEHEAAVVYEDDLVCVPGTYAYLTAALRHYATTEEVMSVTGWTHPRITPRDVGSQPYFDGRAECWVWGTWRRSWVGMSSSAIELMQRCEASGTDVRAYGDDLPFMAEIEASRNLWAVRFIYLHLLRNALCLRPPWSMVEHIGFDEQATNAGYEGWLKNPDLKPAPEIPTAWPPPVENPACAYLHRSATAHPPAESQSLVPSFGFFFSRVRKWMGFD